MRQFNLVMVAAIVTLWVPFAVAAEEYETRFYDLSLFRDFIDPEGEEDFLPLVPFLPLDMDDEYLEELIEYSFLEVYPDQIIDVLYQIIGEEHFEHNGARIHHFGWGLYITTSESIHQRVAAVLGFLESRLSREVDMEIEVYAVNNLAQIEDAGADEIHLAAEEGALSLLLKRSVRTRIGDLAGFDDGEKTSIVWDYDTEIAQASVVCEPIVAQLSVGLRLMARPLPAPDGQGLIVALYGMASRFTEPPAQRELGYAGRLALERQIESVPVGHVIDDPRIEFAGVASFLSVEPGRTAVVRCAFPHFSGTGSLVVLLSANQLPAPELLDLGDGRVLAGFDFHSLQADSLIPIKESRLCPGPMIWNDYDESWERYFTLIGPPRPTCSCNLDEIVAHFDDLLPVEDDSDEERTYFSIEAP